MYEIKISIVMLALVCQSLSRPVACRLSQLPNQEVTLVNPSISRLSGSWLVLSVGQSDCWSSCSIVSQSASLFRVTSVGWPASLFRVAFVGQLASLFMVATSKPDRLTRVGQSLGSPYLSHTALQAPTLRLVGLIVVVSPSLWSPNKLLIVVLMPPPHPLSTQSLPRFLLPTWRLLFWLRRPLFVLIAVVVILRRNDISKIG